MPGLVPAIHVFAFSQNNVDGRDKPGHEGWMNRPLLPGAHAPDRVADVVGDQQCAGLVSARGRAIALDTRHFRQSRAMCGPASLRVVLDYFGTLAPEKIIARACRSSDKTGTTGANLVRGARRLGFAARIVYGADFRTIRRWPTRDTPVMWTG